MSEEVNNSFHYSFKVAIVGDSNVGKTTLLEGENAKSDHQANGASTIISSTGSVGLSFKIKFYEVNGQTYRVQYWDCPGASRYMKLTSRYSAGSAGAIIVFDVNNKNSFLNVQNWIREVEKFSPVEKILVGNKIEDNQACQVSTEEATELAKKYGMTYIETNALTGLGCSQVFQTIFSQIIQSIPVAPEPSLLLKKGIEIGGKLLSDRKYCQSFFLATSKNNKPQPSGSKFADWL